MRDMLLCSMLLAAGCGGSASMTLREPDQYLGCGTDENWRTFDEQERSSMVKSDDAQAAAFQTPAAGATIAAAMKPAFAWSTSATIAGRASGDASCSTVCTLCGGKFPCDLCGQHQPPVNGDVYDLQFSVGGEVVYRVITTLQTWTPPDDLWASWRGKTVSFNPVRMLLRVNDIQEGPFQRTAAITFTVGS